MSEYSYYVISAFGIVFMTLGIYAWRTVFQFIRKQNH